jgi:hypothetical protein
MMTTSTSDDQDRHRVHQRALDLALEGQGLLLIDRQSIEQGLQDAAGLAGLDQVAVQRIKLHGVLAERRGQAGAGLDVGADLAQQLGHARVGGAAADDVKGLQQRHACLHHGGQLAREQGDVALLDGTAAAGAALLDLGQQDALTAQAGTHRCLATGTHLAAQDLAVLVAAFPLEDHVLDGSCG